jgi:hypothetical protein
MAKKCEQMEFVHHFILSDTNKVAPKTCERNASLFYNPTKIQKEYSK